MASWKSRPSPAGIDPRRARPTTGSGVPARGHRNECNHPMQRHWMGAGPDQKGPTGRATPMSCDLGHRFALPLLPAPPRCWTWAPFPGGACGRTTPTPGPPPAGCLRAGGAARPAADFPALSRAGYHPVETLHPTWRLRRAAGGDRGRGAGPGPWRRNRHRLLTVLPRLVTVRRVSALGMREGRIPTAPARWRPCCCTCISGWASPEGSHPRAAGGVAGGPGGRGGARRRGSLRLRPQGEFLARAYALRRRAAGAAGGLAAGRGERGSGRPGAASWRRR